ncbi:NADH-quinone oxidoreductase subunit NuoF [Lentisphaerota bacterium ZTH]|nr:NADH-quinone oxidoreductase subunit NuoF [Lentisphaerota bacterium]WET07449.1 NADH-quinone oxidoreductase subunit NuoF [Lentisphaerota bacterium ZTH]
MNVKKKVDLKAMAAQYKAGIDAVERRIVLCAGTGCVANGSLDVRDELVKELEAAGVDTRIELNVHDDNEKDFTGTYVSKSGCQGFCQMGPLLHIEPDGILYTKVKVGDVKEIVEKTLLGGEVVDHLLYHDPATGKTCRGESDLPFYKRQQRVVLANCMIEPENIFEYVYKGGYEGAEKAVTAMNPADVCQNVLESGIRGRGGGGFPTGLKWKFTLASENAKKYVICNGDEGDPGAFMDRSVMEGNPHAVIEGMMIAAKAIGADEGYVYVRAEYPLAVNRMRRAVKDAETAGLLGKNLFGTDFNFTLHVMEGAGAFVCGEETALIASIEGKRGMPMPKPPFPAQSGLWGKPTVINNVETLASIPMILRNGVEVYKNIGTEKSPGTKTFALTGHVANTGLIEVPFGTTLREIVYNIGGGVTNNAGEVSGEDFKSVQIGGPSGGCLTPEMLDMPLDFDSLKEVGAMVGSGGLVVMNNETCMVKVARFFMQFTQNESCGKCVPCREGTKQMLALLDDIIDGNADASTLKLLEQTAKAVQIGSLCGLGKTAPNPVLSTLKYFRKEYEAHVFDKFCATGECRDLTRPEIDAEKCKGCTACKRKCPVDAISGEVKQPHIIDIEKCIKCGACKEICRFDAVVGL